MVFALLCAVAVAVFALLGGTPEPAAAVKAATQREAKPLKRSDPGVEPQKERVVELSEPEEPEPKPRPRTPPKPGLSPKPEPVPPPEPEPRPDEPTAQADPEPDTEALPDIQAEPPKPTQQDVASAHKERHYDLPEGAVLGLTVKALGIHDAPVFDSVDERALGNGVGHHPETSMPWTDAPQRNVYLAGHRLGFPGTASHLIFYRLGELGGGDEIVLKDRGRKRYVYRVSEAFRADSDDSWVMGQVRDRDMLTLQTCTGPGFSRRLIVRADRQ